MPIERNEYTIQVPNVLGAFLEYFRSHHALEGMDMATFIRWGVVALVWVAIAFWHQQQNRTFHEYINNHKKRTPISDRLSQLAYNRAFEVLGVFFILTLVMVFYDTRIYKTEKDLAETQNLLADSNAQLGELHTALDTAIEERNEAMERTTLSEEAENKLDVLKRQYEELFINYYYLKRCGAIEPESFHLMNSALTHELTQLNAPAGIRKHILTAAKGTHDEMYASASCDSEEINPVKDKISIYLEEVVKNIPDN